jgi:dTDP-4-amino-4,6-dideoxygalactose transaminase
MDALMALAHKRGLKVVEDAAQAHGAIVNGRRAGTVANAGTFSFYPGKNLGACGDAGAVVTPDAEVADRIARARDHGRSGKYTHSFVGRNSRMDGLQAAILRLKLAHLPAWNSRRRAIAQRYRFLLEDLPEVHVIEPHDGEPIYHLFVVECEERDAVREQMESAGIGTGIHYPVPLHLQVAFAGPDQLKEGELPVTERAAGRILSLPIFPEMTDGEADRVVTALSDAVRQVGATSRRNETLRD